jgi:hypothetical protein
MLMLDLRGLKVLLVLKEPRVVLERKVPKGLRER